MTSYTNVHTYLVISINTCSEARASALHQRQWLFNYYASKSIFQEIEDLLGCSSAVGQFQFLEISERSHGAQSGWGDTCATFQIKLRNYDLCIIMTFFMNLYSTHQPVTNIATFSCESCDEWLHLLCCTIEGIISLNLA